MKHIRLNILGMDCASCAISIEKYLMRMSGIEQVTINFATGSAEVSFDENQVTKEIIKQTITNLGYQSVDENKIHRRHTLVNRLVSIRINMYVSVSIACYIMAVMMLPHVPELLRNEWLLAILAGIVQFGPGLRYYKSAWYALKNGMANMDTLIALGTSIAYGYSLIVLIFESKITALGLAHHTYFETSSAIIAFILIGKYLEVRSQRQTSSAIEKLLNLQPAVALVYKNSSWQELPVALIKKDDRILVRPGDSIPVDGIVIDGESSVDASMVTGESKPAYKKKGNMVIGGTVNIGSTLEISAQKVGDETMLARIIAIVRHAQSSRAPIQRLVDKVSSVFVPIIIILALVTFILWFIFGPAPHLIYSLTAAITVLIISCPCALGLATPISIVVSIGRAAHEGVLIKDAASLEKARDINMVVFDKTGTLTIGKQVIKEFRIGLHLDNILDESKNKEEDLLVLIIALEIRSTHGVARTIVKYLQEHFPDAYNQAQKINVQKVATISGLGMRARISSYDVTIGATQIAHDENIKIPPEMQNSIDRWQDQGNVVSVAIINKQIVACFLIEDPLRLEAKKTIEILHKRKIKTIMLTGDNLNVAQSIAHEVGIDEFFAEVSPDEKSEKIRDLRKQNRVAMVGDGINDAPSLAQSDFGIAIGEGTEIAIEAADAVLLRNNLLLVPLILTLSDVTVRNIRQNIGWAFGYNIILIPIAMGILYPWFGITINPIFASIAMSLSSITVVLNALRLRWIKLN